jgi:hypothetical protein
MSFLPAANAAGLHVHDNNSSDNGNAIRQPRNKTTTQKQAWMQAQLCNKPGTVAATL